MEHDLELAALVVIVAAWLGSHVLRRRFPGPAASLQLIAGLVARVAAGAIFVAIAIRTAQQGGLWLLLTALCGLIAAVSFCFAGLGLFVLARRR